MSCEGIIARLLGKQTDIRSQSSNTPEVSVVPNPFDDKDTLRKSAFIRIPGALRCDKGELEAARKTLLEGKVRQGTDNKIV